jgi:hypothetical protein
MGEGMIEPSPLFVLANGEEVFKVKLDKATYELILIATQEIPKQYDEYGLRKEKFFMYAETVRTHLEEAKYLIREDVIKAQDEINFASNMLLSLSNDFAFGDKYREQLEMAICFLCTKSMNPYSYDYGAKQDLMNKILAEKDRLLPFIYRLPVMSLLNISQDLEATLANVSLTEKGTARGASKMLQWNILKIIEQADFLTSKTTSQSIIRELETLTRTIL